MNKVIYETIKSYEEALDKAMGTMTDYTHVRPLLCGVIYSHYGVDADIVAEWDAYGALRQKLRYARDCKTHSIEVNAQEIDDLLDMIDDRLMSVSE